MAALFVVRANQNEKIKIKVKVTHLKTHHFSSIYLSNINDKAWFVIPIEVRQINKQIIIYIYGKQESIEWEELRDN